MGSRLKNKVAIVTGSTSGIGVGIAKAFAREGAQVILCGRRVEKGQGIVDEIVAAKGKASFHVMDVTKPESIKALIDDTVKEFGRLDILVNNAANVALKDGRVDELTLDMWDAIFDSDLRGTFYACQCAIPYMKANVDKKNNPLGGSIINIGSMASCGGDLGSTAYACAKAGVDMLTKDIALQYGKDGIRCNCVRPGLIVTPDNDAKVPEFLRSVFLESICVNRTGTPDDIANLCLYLASDESSYTTGQVMTVDGGMNTHVSTVASMKALNKRTW